MECKKHELNNKNNKSQFNIVIWLGNPNTLLETMNKAVGILMADVNIHCCEKQFVAVTCFFPHLFVFRLQMHYIITQTL